MRTLFTLAVAPALLAGLLVAGTAGTAQAVEASSRVVVVCVWTSGEYVCAGVST